MIRDRIDDALLLWQHDRREGAFLSVLVAVAVTARLRFPDPSVGDRQAFERFLYAAHSVRLSVEYRGACHPVEHVFYKWLRCELVHEAGVPLDIVFVPTERRGELSVRAGGPPSYVLQLSESWFDHLVHTVASAPEVQVSFLDWPQRYSAAT